MPRIIPRAKWGARHGRGSDVSGNLPWGEVVAHTEAVTRSPTSSPETEAQWVRNVERYHAVDRGWTGIGYSFLIGPSGAIFEGRGWGRSGAHTESRNSTAAGVCFLGHGDNQPATEAQWSSFRWLIGEGIRLGHLRREPLITGHRQYSRKGKSCPGNLIYPHLDRLRGITGTTTTTPSKSTPKPTPTPNTEETELMAASDDIIKALKAHIDKRLMEDQGRENTEDKGDDAAAAMYHTSIAKRIDDVGGRLDRIEAALGLRKG